jgi:hypothetical protein
MEMKWGLKNSWLHTIGLQNLGNLFGVRNIHGAGRAVSQYLAK